MTSFERMYDTLRHYGNRIASRDHETTEGNIITFHTYSHNDKYYVVTMFNGNVFMVAEKADIKELL